MKIIHDKGLVKVCAETAVVNPAFTHACVVLFDGRLLRSSKGEVGHGQTCMVYSRQARRI